MLFRSGSAGAAGADGYTVTLSNEYIEIPTGADRKPTSATTYSCTVSVYKGTTALTPTTSTPADGQFRVQTGTAPTGITVAQSTAGTITLTTSTATAIADVSSLTLTITPYGASAITAVISISANMNAVTVTTKTLAEQTADQFTWIVASGTSASNFTLTSRMATLISDEIDLTGYVTFSNLQTSGQTIINADNLTTGTINAANVNLKGALSCLDSAGDATGNLNLVTADLYTSYVTGSNYMFGMSIDSRASGYNFGVGVQYSDANNTRPEMAMLWTPLSGVSCTWDESNHTGTLDIFAENNVFIWTDILYFDGTAKWWSSDRRVKSEVDYNVDRFLGAFDALRPCSFLYNSSRDGRRNIGMIAQDVEKALQDNGIDVGKINLVGTSSKTGQYFLDYDQFIPILIAKVQSQQKQIDALEAKLS